MAFNINKVNKIGGQALFGNAPQVLTYSNDAGDTVTAVGFFNPLAQQVAMGDIVRVVTYTSSLPSAVVDYLVVSITAGVVKIVVSS